MKLYIETFGCQMNVLDSQLVEGSLARDGYTKVSTPDEADLILYNTCSVRDRAEEKVRSRLGRIRGLKESRPDLVIGILGCMAQRESGKLLSAWPHVDLVCGTRELHRVPELVREIQESRRPAKATDIRADFVFDTMPRPGVDGPLAYVSVMRGCDNVCSFCVVPRTRGRENSKPLQAVVDELKGLIDQGVKEVMLLGQNINSYGKGLPGEPDLADLLAALDPIPGLERIRFVTSNPWDMTEKLFRAMEELPTVCEYLHFPFQSGSDRILESMRRDYTAKDYLHLVDRARALVPTIELATDIIVGYPGEEDEDFEATVRMVREVEFLQAYIFKYSVRPGTTAVRLGDSVPTPTKKSRNRILLEIQDEITLRKRKEKVGQTEQVLVEGPSKKVPEIFSGRTRQNHLAVFPPDGTVPGDLVDVLVADCTPRVLRGEVCSR
ncbi:MAG: tRNA (N6-isopentenyl adenosine(37)-C2)-methylthiotransferase MiaB [Planctomycetota bacterium]|nr:tRNA (N6-isopentenyl adenosine(37)-C2)-methylthiotransferase MiaB [Planctomycetota bacterium]